MFKDAKFSFANTDSRLVESDSSDEESDMSLNIKNLSQFKLMKDPNFKKFAGTEGRKREDSMDSSDFDQSEKSPIKQNHVKVIFDWSKADPNKISDEEIDA